VKTPEVTAIIGGQWGDEGKGKIVDYLATDADVVIRSQGGDNAGHTVINDKGKFGLHLVPAGIFNARTVNIIGAGVALNPKTLMSEMKELSGRGVSFDNLIISPKSHLAFDYHMLIDQEQERRRGSKKIETTKRGIGPTYMDKAERIGLPTRLLLDPARLLKEMEVVLEAKRRQLGIKDERLTVDYYADFVRDASKTLGHFIQSTEDIVSKNLADGKKFLLEGAHGTLLDLDHGTYPMVTASNSTVGGLLVGAGMPPLALTKVVGVFKAYQTRVGAGGMPTELPDDLASIIRDKGQEFGTTTGRPRRIGYFDGVAARYAHQINGFTHIAVTKVDTLEDIDPLKICTEYEIAGRTVEFQPDNQQLADCLPRYVATTGWSHAEAAGATRYEELPVSVRDYCQAIVDTMPGAKLGFVGIGRAREQLITL
jgi:adenylosuccinate synthase